MKLRTISRLTGAVRIEPGESRQLGPPVLEGTGRGPRGPGWLVEGRERGVRRGEFGDVAASPVCSPASKAARYEGSLSRPSSTSTWHSASGRATPWWAPIGVDHTVGPGRN